MRYTGLPRADPVAVAGGNVSAAWKVIVEGAPQDVFAWSVQLTSESDSFAELPPVANDSGTPRLQIPERALVTF